MDKIHEELISWNINKIIQLEHILGDFQDKVSSFQQTQVPCFDKLIRLSYAWCGLPFGNYGEIYYYTLERPPLGKEFNVEMGSMGKQPDGWIQLTSEQKDLFERKLPDADSIRDKIIEVSENLKPLIMEIVDENSILKNYSDFDDEYSELKEQEKKWSFTREKAIEKYAKNKVITRDIVLAQSGMVYPYHSRLMAYYDSIYTTTALIEKKIENTIRILKRINKNLPFSKIKTKEDERFQLSSLNIGTYVHGNGNILNETSGYANSGKMNLNIENDSQMEELLKNLLNDLKETKNLSGYQKDDVAEDIYKIIAELGKPVEKQDKGFIEHTLKKTWGVTKDIMTVSASLTSIAVALGVTF